MPIVDYLGTCRFHLNFRTALGVRRHLKKKPIKAKSNGSWHYLSPSSNDHTSKRVYSCRAMATRAKSSERSEKSSAKLRKEPCAVCSLAVIDGKDEAVFCEGECQAWIHRRCAGVSVCSFRRLLSSPDEFLCAFCSDQAHRKSLSLLELEVASLKAENAKLSATVEAIQSADNDTISILLNSVSRLKEEVSLLRREKPSDKNGAENQSARVSEKKGKKAQPRVSNITSKPQVQLSKEKRQSIPVENARKVWGTMKSATTAIVLNAIKRVSEKLDSLSVKRKYQAHNGITKRWWFVVRGTKADIELLESEWSKIEMQTGWLLQPLLSYANTFVDTPIVSDNGAAKTSSSVTVMSPKQISLIPSSSALAQPLHLPVEPTGNLAAAESPSPVECSVTDKTPLAVSSLTPSLANQPATSSVSLAVSSPSLSPANQPTTASVTTQR